MKSVLAGFIGTYTSRYSDYRGYWLHGQLSFDKLYYGFDLLGSASDTDTPEGVACRLAIRRFTEQVIRSGLKLDAIREATLHIQMDPEIVRGWQGNQVSDGHNVHFIVSAVMTNKHKYETQHTLFVAPHDPGKEQRRLPDDWGEK